MDTHEIVGQILKSHGLKKTLIRTEMLELFMKSEFALSAGDVLKKLGIDSDRVTVYRALNSFEENGILHKASEDNQGVRYALCSQGCPEESHTEKHAHFICDECHHTFCLEDVKIPKVKLSSDFSVKRFNYTVSGTCKTCSV